VPVFGGSWLIDLEELVVLSVVFSFVWSWSRHFQFGLRSLLLVLSASLFSNVAMAADKTEAINVLASIKPLQLIAQAVTSGVADTRVLLPAGTTPHDYALKPSDLMRVYKTDLLLWLGAPYEPYLAKAVKMRGVTDLAALNFDDAQLQEHHEGHDHGGHSHLYGDPHVWFGPDEALAIAQSLVGILVQRDAVNAAQYHANLERFRNQLSVLDKDLRARFSEISNQHYLVYHDAYSYFENHYGLRHVAQVTEQPESKPGAKSLLALRKLILNGGVSCLFVEPQSDADIVALLQEGSELKIYQLDPMATDFPVDKTGYVSFIQRTADRFAECR